MATINKQELIHIANLSALKLEDKEIDFFVQQIQTILTYVDQLQKIKVSDIPTHVGNVNLLRDDIVHKADAAAVLAQAPQRDGQYFAVPKILDEK